MIVRPQSGGGLLDGEWELNLPVQLKGSATVTGSGARIETWQRKIGLKKGYHKFPDHPGWEGTERFTQLRLEVDKDGVGGDLGLSGDYDLRPKCGTAQQGCNSIDILNFDWAKFRGNFSTGLSIRSGQTFR